MENEKWLIEGGLLIYLVSKCAFLAVIFSAVCIFRCYSITWENSHLSSIPPNRDDLSLPRKTS